MIEVTCAICKGPTRQSFAYVQDTEGRLWRSPVHVCITPSCLAARGAMLTTTVPVGGIRAIKGREGEFLPTTRSSKTEIRTDGTVFIDGEPQ